MILNFITSCIIPKDCLESEVFDLLIAKKWALKYAVNAACTILRVRYHKIQKSTSVNACVISLKTVCKKIRL